MVLVGSAKDLKRIIGNLMVQFMTPRVRLYPLYSSLIMKLA
jgi:hypothetical protein